MIKNTQILVIGILVLVFCVSSFLIIVGQPHYIDNNEPTPEELAGQSPNIGFTKVVVVAPDGTVRKVYSGDDL